MLSFCVLRSRSLMTKSPINCPVLSAPCSFIKLIDHFIYCLKTSYHEIVISLQIHAYYTLHGIFHIKAWVNIAFCITYFLKDFQSLLIIPHCLHKAIDAFLHNNIIVFSDAFQTRGYIPFELILFNFWLSLECNVIGANCII